MIQAKKHLNSIGKDFLVKKLLKLKGKQLLCIKMEQPYKKLSKMYMQNWQQEIAL